MPVKTRKLLKVESTEPAAVTGQSLQALYQLVHKRKVRGKPFFGYGSWEGYLKGVHGTP